MTETIRESLNQMRERRPDVTGLMLCKGELFYLPMPSPCGPEDTVYPVTRAVASKEAASLGVTFSEE